MKTVRAVLLATVCLISPANAQNMNIDLTKMPPDVAAAIVKAEQERKTNIKVPSTIDEAKKYAEIGEQVGTAIAATAKALSVEVNDFVKTPVGWWAFIFVFWYFLGAKLWHIVGGIIFWTIFTFMIWKSLKYFHIPRRVLVAVNGKEKRYEYQDFKWKSNEAKALSATVHASFFVVFTIVSLFLVF